MNVPESITAHVVTPDGDGVERVVLELEVRAGRKNPYHIHFPATDRHGKAELLHDDFIGQFEDHWEAGLMDHDRTLETAASVVEVRLFDPTWLRANRNLALAWPLFKHEQKKWRSREEEYLYRSSCRNSEFTGRAQLVDLEHTAAIRFVIERK